MSCFISELLIPQDSRGAPWIGCQHCRRREDCPYVRNQALRHAAYQGHAAAQLLAAEADRLFEAAVQADDVRCLLNADENLERALSCVLYSELALVHSLRTQPAESSP